MIFMGIFGHKGWEKKKDRVFRSFFDGKIGIIIPYSFWAQDNFVGAIGYGLHHGSVATTFLGFIQKVIGIV